MIRTLKVKTYHTDDGKQVCSRNILNMNCVFLRTKRLGTEFECGYLCEELLYGDDGWLRPTEGCPVRGDRK